MNSWDGYDKFIKLPHNLNPDQLAQIDAYFKKHELGYVERTYMGMMGHIKDHVTEDDALKHVNAICAMLKLCLICGQPIGWTGNAWRHEAAKSFGVNPCALQNDDLPIPPPSYDHEGEGALESVEFYVRQSNVGLDAAVGVERMRLVGRALRHGFGPDWLKERND